MQCVLPNTTDSEPTAARCRDAMQARTELPLSWSIVSYPSNLSLEVAVAHRPDGTSVSRSIVTVEETETGWQVVDAADLTALDVAELLADVARWACGSPRPYFFEQEIR